MSDILDEVAELWRGTDELPTVISGTIFDVGGVQAIRLELPLSLWRVCWGSTRMIWRMVAEIKRLRVELCAAKHHVMRRDEDISNLMKEIAAKDSQNNDLMANCNQLRDRCWKAESELARWRQIAFEYIQKRKEDIRKEQKRIHVFPPSRREIVRRQLRGRVLELEKLRILIEQGKMSTTHD